MDNFSQIVYFMTVIILVFPLSIVISYVFLFIVFIPVFVFEMISHLVKVLSTIKNHMVSH